MKRALARVVALLGLSAVVVAQAPLPALNGVWKPDTSQGSMKMVPLDRRLAVTLNGSEIVFQEGPAGEPSRQTTKRYRVGAEAENAYLPGRTEKATAAWDAGRLVITGQRQMGADARPTPFSLTVSVSADGTELRMEERVDTGSTVFTSLRVFTRER